MSSGSVNLGGATLNAAMNPGLTPTVGQQFTIINNQSGTPITTTFAGLPQNAVTTIGGFSFSINYSAGVGNDSVVLTRVAAPPSVSLNPPSANYTSTWTGTALGIGPTATVTNPSGGNVLSLTASLTSVHGGDVLADGTANGNVVAGTSITSSYNAGTGVLTLSGADTAAHYQQVLESITYNNTNGGPGVSSETVSVVATDAIGSSTAVTDTITVNVSPVVLLNPASANYTSTWSGSAVAIANSTATITDGESGAHRTDGHAHHGRHSDRRRFAGRWHGQRQRRGGDEHHFQLQRQQGHADLQRYRHRRPTISKCCGRSRTTTPPAVRAVGTETVTSWPHDGTDSSTRPSATINVNVAPVVLLNSPTANYSTTLYQRRPGGDHRVGAAAITDGETGNLIRLTASIVSLHSGDVLRPTAWRARASLPATMPARAC